MRAFTRVELTVRTETDALACTTVREDGWVERFALPVFALVVVLMFWQQGSLPMRAIAFLAAFVVSVSTLAPLVQGPSATLRVSSAEVASTGALGRWFRTRLRIPVGRILSVNFSSGQEGEHSGIYVRHGLRQTCVLPRIDAVQGEQILQAMRSLFPQLPVEATVERVTLVRRLQAIVHFTRRRGERSSG